MPFEEKYNNRDNIVVPSSNWFPDDYDDIDYDEIVTTESLQEEGLKRSIQKVRKAWRKLIACKLANKPPKHGTGTVHLLFEGDIYDCGRPINRKSFDVCTTSDWEFICKHVTCKRCYKLAEYNNTRFETLWDATDAVDGAVGPAAIKYVDQVADEFEKLGIIYDPDVLASAGLSEADFAGCRLASLDEAATSETE